jgi:hypothetical protein
MSSTFDVMLGDLPAFEAVWRFMKGNMDDGRGPESIHPSHARGQTTEPLSSSDSLIKTGTKFL